VVVLPTGTGKTHLANLAIARAGRPTLVVTPTIDLLNQWYDELTLCFEAEVGLLGGGYYDIRPLTVTTYDSAYIHAERYGDRFALVIYDEVHHLPAPKNAIIPKMLLAPYSLGLTATPERPDGGHGLLPELAGPIVYRRSPEDLAGTYLAPFELVRVPIELTAQERFDYAQAEAVYRDFLEKHRLPMRSPEDWQRFIMVASTSHSGGREALLAARRRREIREGAMRKGATLETLLRQHGEDRCIVFTKSVEEVYALSRRFLIPGLTYETPARERKEILDRFRIGRYRAIIASDVLNEGVDVPDANVAIILAGSASQREYVQRLGRILRPKRDKQAVLYELVTAAGLPPYSRNVTVAGEEVDAYWPEANLVVELQSYRWHTDRSAFERDHSKLARLKIAGIETLALTYRQVTEEPAWVIEALRSLLSGRRGEGFPA